MRMPPPARFEATFDEIVNACVRAGELRGEGSGIILIRALAAAALSAFAYIAVPQSRTVKITLAFLTAVIAAVIDVKTRRQLIRKRALAYCSGLYSAATTSTFEYRLRDDGIAFKSPAVERLVPWGGVAASRVTPGLLEIVTDAFEVAQIPARAFDSPGDMKAWAETIALKTRLPPRA